jgi:hypothetical protein
MTEIVGGGVVTVKGTVLLAAVTCEDEVMTRML